MTERRGWENVSFVQADATDPPIRSADAVLATFVTSLFPDPYAAVSGWCELADSVVIAAFAPRGSRPANAALSAFCQIERPAVRRGRGRPARPARRTDGGGATALADTAETVTEERYLFGTITMCAGYGCAGDRCG